MNGRPPQKDLVVLAADKDIEQSISGLLTRHRSLSIRDISGTTDIFTHPEHDPGCYNRGIEFLRSCTSMYEYAMVIFDYEGCGNTTKQPREIENDLETRLQRSGWKNNACVITIAPELENWIWSDSYDHVGNALGWKNQTTVMYQWLKDQGYYSDTFPKPSRPKEAMQSALKHAGKPRSSSIYYDLATKVSLATCSDPAFKKLKDKLSEWFSQP